MNDLCRYLIGAPVPNSRHRCSKYHSSPRQIRFTRYDTSKQMHGVFGNLRARFICERVYGRVVGVRIGNEELADQFVVATDFMES